MFESTDKIGFSIHVANLRTTPVSFQPAVREATLLHELLEVAGRLMVCSEFPRSGARSLNSSLNSRTHPMSGTDRVPDLRHGFSNNPRECSSSLLSHTLWWTRNWTDRIMRNRQNDFSRSWLLRLARAMALIPILEARRLHVIQYPKRRKKKKEVVRDCEPAHENSVKCRSRLNVQNSGRDATSLGSTGIRETLLCASSLLPRIMIEWLMNKPFKKVCI